MANPWNKTELITEDGQNVEAIAPVIISASRSTDLPAFFSKWFFNRLEKGYVKWTNPFNRNTPQYVSFENMRVVVFWTKNPKPIIPYLKKLDEQNIHYYFQYTVNDYEKEGFEPNVPNLKNRIETFKKLSQTIGKEKVIWRFDPLLLTEKLSPRDLLKKIWYLGNQLLPYTNKLVFSFADISDYKKVQNNLVKDHPECYTKDNVLLAEFSKEQKQEFAQGMQRILKEWRQKNPNFNIATCAEDIDLSQYDIEHNKCIDDDLMIQLFKADKKLMSFLGYYDTQQNLFGLKPNLKDKGQRKSCGCIISKDIGSYNTCNHLCTYCYANTSRKVVKGNLYKLDEHAESILG